MAVLDELTRLGFIDIRPLEKLAYTNGVTYEFKKGRYFTCHKQNDIESTIYNSKLKKLGRTRNNEVELRIKDSAPTRSFDTAPSGRTMRRAESDVIKGCQLFNAVKIRAALIAADAKINITENCGIRPVFNFTAPSSEVSHYEIEMKKMRDRLIADNKITIEKLPVMWKMVKYVDGGLGGGGNQWTPNHYEILKNYEIRNIDGEIRHKDTKRINRSNTLSCTINGKKIQVGISRHRAYMYTFMTKERREHQTVIDHIDGDETNNVPWNYRWASVDENNLAKHAEMTERVVPDQETLLALHGHPADPKVWNGWTFCSNMWISRPDTTPQFIKLANSKKYPRIGVTLKDANGQTKLHRIKCHRIVAYVHRAFIPISELASIKLESVGKSSTYFQSYTSTYFQYAEELVKYGLIIMHTDDDKSNYNLNNLKIGTHSENNQDRHENPKTTSRKRIDVIDIATHKRIKTFDSQIETAKWFGVTKPAISYAVCINRTRTLETYQKTKNKTTDATYYVIDAAADM